MLKDKKIIEKGKYMVYNTGIRRPPAYRRRPPGAPDAVLPGKDQVSSEKQRFRPDPFVSWITLTSPMKTSMTWWASETYIVPVNITYFPIRAKHNAMNNIIRRFVEGCPGPAGRGDRG